MKIVFWNVQSKDLTDIIEKLVQQENPDIVIIAEAEKIRIFNGTYQELNKIKIKTHPTKELRFFHKKSIKCTDLQELEEQRSSAKKIRLKIKGKTESIILVSLHLVSKMTNNSLADNRLILDKLDREVESLKRRNKTDKVIFIGDFNLTPEEEPLRSMSGLMTSNCPETSETKDSRGVKKTIYYNPSQYLLSNFNLDALGSFYYKGDKNWHQLDQVIFSKNLLEFFQRSEFKILILPELKFLDSKRRPLISDHLPIMCNFDF